MKTIPGGVTLDNRGVPRDANGNRLPALPDTLSEEERATCREAGLVTANQAEYYGLEELMARFGIDEPLARKARGESVEVDATSGATELAEEEGIDLASIEGSGKDGRVTKADVEDAIESDE